MGCVVRRVLAGSSARAGAPKAVITVICINPGAKEHNQEAALAQLKIARGPAYPKTFSHNVETPLGFTPDVATSIGAYYDLAEMAEAGIVCIRVCDLINQFDGKIPACDRLWCTRTLLEIFGLGYVGPGRVRRAVTHRELRAIPAGSSSATTSSANTGAPFSLPCSQDRA